MGADMVRFLVSVTTPERSESMLMEAPDQVDAVRRALEIYKDEEVLIVSVSRLLDSMSFGRRRRNGEQKE